MPPSKTDVRRWYGASIVLGIPLWVFVPSGLMYVLIGYVSAWIAALVGTPRVDLPRRLFGILLTVGLTLSLWFPLVAASLAIYGDPSFE